MSAPALPSAVERSDPGDGSSFHSAVVRQELSVRLFGPGHVAPVRLDHYHLLRVLGYGGIGVVFDAVDQRTGHRLALKLIQRGKGGSAQLKREFRALADLSHPNLVTLHELNLEGSAPYFTMELVRGQHLLSFVRPGGTLDCGRLRSVLGQLVDVVDVLHRCGRLHRDLKPSNLMVQADGRLVVLDFGLTQVIGERLRSGPGTPAYAAPELREGGEYDQSSDWYSVGVILHEALTAKLPGPGSPEATQRAHGPAADLFELAAQLLSASPADRPSGHALRSALGVAFGHTAPLRSPRLHASHFVGRSAELSELWRGFAGAEAGQATAVLVHGEPGIGKTALAGEFLRRLAPTERATILTSRCHPSEYIRYNVIDGLIDAMVAAQHAPFLREALHDALDGSAELATLFPALRALTDAAGTALSEPQRARAKAFVALRELLQRIGERHPLVLHLDDLQWGDGDSAELLTHVLQPPAPRRLLLVVTYRSDGHAAPCVRGLAETCGPMARVLPLAPLDAQDSLLLARSVAGGAIEHGELQTLSEEAGGSPLFLELLLQRQGPPRAQQSRTGVRDAIQQLIDELAPTRRSLLEVLAVAGGPIERARLLDAAAELGPADQVTEALYGLLRAGLVRPLPPQQTRLEPYHERLRESVLLHVAEDQRRACHLALARSAARRETHDADFAAQHFEHAGEWAAAADFAERAGDRALRGLALEHAARSYEQALRCLGSRPARLLHKLADVLAYHGRSAAAAPLYLEAAASTSNTAALRLRLRAAEMYLRTGELHRGTEVVQPVLRAVGVHYPATNLGAKLACMATLARIALRMKLGLIAERRPTPARSPSELQRADVCFELGRVLSLLGGLRGAALLLRSLELALDGGSDAQRARGLAGYAWMLAATGLGTKEQQLQLLEQARLLAARSGSADTEGWVMTCQAIAMTTRGEFAASDAAASRARAWVARHCADSGWLLTELEYGPCTNLVMMSSMRALDRATRATLEHANQQGSRYHADATLGIRTMVWLAHDRSEHVLAVARQLLADWAQAESCRTTATAAPVLMYCHLYRGEAEEAARVGGRYAGYFASHGYATDRVWSALLNGLYGSIALALASRGNRPRRRLRDVRRSLRRLAAHGGPVCGAHSDLLRAGLACLDGDLARAAIHYRLAADAFDQRDMAGHSAAARVRLAELLPAAQAREVRELAQAWASREGVVDLEAWSRIYAPCCLGSDSEA